MRTRSLAPVLLAALIAAGLPASGADARSGRSERARERTLIEQLGPGAQVTRARDTGRVRSIRGGRRRIATPAELGGPRTPNGAARAFLGRYGELFSIDRPDRQLKVDAVEPAGRAGTYVRFQQVMGGVPVMGGDLVVAVDRGLGVTAVRGEASPDATVDLRARISPARAVRTALATVARATRTPARRLTADRPERWVYDPRLMDGPGLPYARLVWRIRVHDALGRVDQLVAVDARSGAVALRFSQVHASSPEIASQRICDQTKKRETQLDRVPCADGVKLTSFAGEALLVKQATQATYAFYLKRFGYDLPADLNAQAVLISTINYCPPAGLGGCPLYENAFWNGKQMVYGAGYASADDVVGHELSHAVTEKASSLFYYMESGAINEALSDIFGEAIDLTHPELGSDGAAKRWLIGEDLPGGAIRDMADPPDMGQPEEVGQPLYWDEDPSELDSGGVHTNSGVANRAFQRMVDGDGVPALDADPSISLDQAAAIWYHAAAHLLTSASDYADLGDALGIACDTLIGVAGAVKDGAGNDSTPIAADDCAADGPVRGAVTKGKMRLADRDDPPAAIPVCTDPAATPTYLVKDPITADGIGWTFDSGPGRRWGTWDGYGFPDPDVPASRPWHLVGDDLATRGDRRAYRSAGTTIPSATKPVFLRFRHAFGFDDCSEDLNPNDRRYDGGVVEVSANKGAWRDIGPLFTDGGYRKRIFSGDTNPLKGRLAFTAESRGYTAARANLSGYPGLSFAGTKARVSFRIGTDGSFAGEGWFIDDVALYTCDNPADTDGPVLGGVRTGLSAGAMTAAGRVPGFILGTAADPAGVASVAGLVSVGATPATAIGGSVRERVARGTLPTSTLLQHHTYRATDELGNVTSETIDHHVGRTEETGLAFAGGWKRATIGAASGGAVRFARAKGATATFALGTATSVALVSTVGPDRGTAKVCRGASCTVIDLYAPTTQARRIAWVANDLPGGGTLTVTATGKKNVRSRGTRVDIDAVVTIAP